MKHGWECHQCLWTNIVITWQNKERIETSRQTCERSPLCRKTWSPCLPGLHLKEQNLWCRQGELEKYKAERHRLWRSYNRLYTPRSMTLQINGHFFSWQCSFFLQKQSLFLVLGSGYYPLSWDTWVWDGKAYKFRSLAGHSQVYFPWHAGLSHHCSEFCV